MIHPDAAKKIMEQNVKFLQSEDVEIEKALGRVLYEDIISDLDSPPFDKSAMDGFAYNSNDEGKPLKITSIVAAGDSEEFSIKKGECMEIMTGAKIPKNANKVIPIENVTIKDGYIEFTPSKNDNIIKQGENLKKGDVVLTKKILKPQHIGILASLGCRYVKVAKLPEIGIITTGTEIVEPGNPLQDGQIYNSNGYQLIAQSKSIGIDAKYYGSLSDDKEKIAQTIKKALSEQDILILSGGVSMGKFDFIPAALQDIGVDILFHKLAIKPGKPTLFGKKDDKFVFGLPGNPVSTFVIFEVVIKPFIYKMMGLDYQPPISKGILTKNLKRKKSARFEYIPVILKDKKIYPLKYHGSSHLNILADANGLIRYEKGQLEIPEGSELDVRQI